MSVFLDTSYLVAFSNNHDPNHVRALMLSENLGNFEFGSPFTSTFIVDETITYTLQKENHERAVQVVEEILCSEIEVIDLDFERLGTQLVQVDFSLNNHSVTNKLIGFVGAESQIHLRHSHSWKV